MKNKEYIIPGIKFYRYIMGTERTRFTCAECSGHRTIKLVHWANPIWEEEGVVDIILKRDRCLKLFECFSGPLYSLEEVFLEYNYIST